MDVVVALLASGITAVASLGVVAVQAVLQRRHREQEALVKAYVILLSGSLRLTHKADALRQTKHWRSGVRESVNLLLRFTKPLDPMQLHDWLAADMARVEAAWAEIWTSGDQEGIRLANALMKAFEDVMGEAMRSPGADDWSPGLTAAVRRLMGARRQLAMHTRRISRAGTKGVDLFLGGDDEPLQAADRPATSS